MATFSQARLEGKALEEELAGHAGLGIRMLDEKTSQWVVVRGEQAKCIRLQMRRRVKVLRDELSSAGLGILSADRPLRVDGECVSVDLRIWCRTRGAVALVEVKWSRQSLAIALNEGMDKIPVLKKACRSGSWVQSSGKVGGKVKAAMAGVLAVGPSDWRCYLVQAQGNWTSTTSRAPTTSRAQPFVLVPTTTKKQFRGSKRSGRSGPSGRSGASGHDYRMQSGIAYGTFGYDAHKFGEDPKKVKNKAQVKYRAKIRAKRRAQQR